VSKILVIDDNEQIRDYLVKVLELEDYVVATAPNGKIGLEYFETDTADLIITDIIMPEKEGLETIMEIKRGHPDIKIIAISGGSNNMGPEYCLGMAKLLGANSVLEKPFSREILLDTIQKLLPS